MEHRLRVGVSLVLSALFSQVVCAEVCPTASAKTEDLTVNAGTTCQISSEQKVKEKVTNNGTIIFTSSGSKITFEGNGTPPASLVTIDGGTTRGAIKVRGDATIDASKDQGLTIEGQDISIDKDRSLTLKATKITFGGDSNKSVTISGDSYVSSSTSYKNVILDTTTEIMLKDLSLTNIRMSGTALATLTNTKLTLKNSYITSDTDLTIKGGDSNSSTFIATKDSSSTISAKKITIKNDSNGATHTFKGEGIIDFQANEITLGDSSNKTTLKQAKGDKSKEGEGQTTVGFIADTKLLATKLEVDGIKMQVVKNSEATLSNVDTTFKGAILQALDRDNKDQVLVIENGNTDTQNAGKIGIATIAVNGNQAEDSITTFMGSGIKIYGQEITINGDTAKSNTLTLQTINDLGTITLGKKNTDSKTPPPPPTAQNKDGEVTIKGASNSSEKKNLQLRGVNTVIGGKVSLESLNIQTHSSKEGMVFSQGNDGELTLKKINLTSGIKDEKGKGNYQSLSFISENTGKISVNGSDNKPSTLKASEFSFTNQEISLTNNATGSTLSLYAMGKTSLTSNLGEGMGVFSFDNTSIKDGSNAKLALYSQDGAKINAHHLTLDGVTLETYALNGVKTDSKNAIDLSTQGNDITIKNSVTIDTQKFLYGEGKQGIGADITIIGNSSNSLTLKASESADSFTLGGTVTLDNSSQGGNTSLLNIELNSKKTENKEISLNINGGLTAIGKVNGNNGSTTTTLKAKSFVFGEGVVVSSINGTLKFESGDNGGIDISKGQVILKGLSNAEASITKQNGGNLKLGDVFATGKTKIENATFVDSNLTVRAYDTNANTLTIKNNTEVKGIKTIDIEDAKIDVKNGSSQELQLNVGGSITSRGSSTISASSIKGDNGSGTYDINVQNGTLTLQETSSAGNGIGSVTLGLQGRQGGSLVMSKNGDHNDFQAQNITSYKDSTITANQFSFNDKAVTISSTGGELKFIAKSSNNAETLIIKSREINLNHGGLSYYKSNGTQELKKLTLYNTSTSVAIHSKGNSFIEASELGLSGNTITSSGGFLTLKGVSDSSTFGNITIGDHGGLSAVKKNSNDYEQTNIKLKDSSTLTLQANVPFTSSSNLLGGGKFGVLQAKTLEFASNGGISSPLIKIEILQKPIEGEELFTLREGKQIVVETQEGIFKGVNGKSQTSKTSIALDDIFVAPTGYESLSLTAQLLDDKQAEIATGGKAHSIQVTLKALQGTAWEKSESIKDPFAQSQMQALIKNERNEEILDNILLSSNPLKAGFSELIAQGDVVTVGNAVNYISDTYTSLANSVIFNDRIQTQLAQMQATNIANRLARGKNPHNGKEELARFIRSYHNTAYASSDEDLPSEESAPTHKGELWGSYDGSMATGNGANSLVNGVMIGYDYDLNDNVLLGGLVQYGYASFDGSYIHTTSNNVALALYSRMYFGGNELDVSVSENFGFNRANIQVGATAMPQQLNGGMDYDVFRTTASLIYGYRFGVGEEESPYYLKPLVGVEFSYLYQEEGISDSLVPLYSSAMHALKASVSVGMEMRKYFTAENYIFLTPAIMRDVYSGGSDAQVGFVDVKKMTYAPNYVSQTSLGLQAGGEGKVGENLSVNGSLGFRLGIEKTELLTNWSVGLKYKF